jgi:hypothetical protein
MDPEKSIKENENLRFTQKKLLTKKIVLKLYFIR